jgi:hypothetical protein
MTSGISKPELRDAAWNAHERELLAAAQEETVPRALSERMRAQLELQLGPPAAASTSAALHKLSPLGWKAPLWGVLSLLAVGSFGYLALTGGKGDASAPQRASSAAVVPARTDAHAEQAVSPVPASAVGVAAVGGDHDRLREEAELLDRTRKALSRGDLLEARQLLSRYAAEFEHGALHPERDVLGVELDVRSGQLRSAKTNAARFLAANPHHPLRDRVRELVKTR